MKKLISLTLCLVLVFSLAACGADSTEETQNPSESTSDDTGVTNPTADALLSDGELDTGMKEKFDQMEYAAYIDLFYNDNGSSYEGKKLTKEGTFGTIYDAFGDVTRYYVWGYADNTKCCDYQWEFVLPEGAEVPEPGSYITVSGTMTADAAALDGYWLKDATLEVKEEFSSAGFDLDMTTMSPTLVRVEVINMLQFPEKFADKKVRLFGRALSENTVQHPYYNESWTMHFTKTDTVPAIGKYILIEGTYNKGNADDKQITTDKLTVIG